MPDELVVDPSPPLNAQFLKFEDGSHVQIASLSQEAGEIVLDPSAPRRMRYLRHEDGSHTPIVSIDGGGGNGEDGPSAATPAAILAGLQDDTFLAPKPTWEAHIPAPITVASGVATPDLAAGINFTLVLSGNTTLANPANPKPGQTFTISVTRAGAQTLSFGSAYIGIDNINMPGTAGKRGVVVGKVVSTSPLAVEVSVGREV